MKLYIVFPVLLLVAAGCTDKSSTKNVLSENSDLKVGQELERTLKPHVADTFKIILNDKAFVTGHADQLSFDAVVRITGPDVDVTFDGPSDGPETFYF